MKNLSLALKFIIVIILLTLLFSITCHSQYVMTINDLKTQDVCDSIRCNGCEKRWQKVTFVT